MIIAKLFIYSYIFVQLLVFLGCSACSQSNTLFGCVTCDSTTPVQVYNATDGKYTCIDITNCATVAGDICTSCIDNYMLNSINQCSQAIGCITFSSTFQCTQCADDYILTSGTCITKQIQYCQQYSDSGNCSKCKYEYMLSATNCSVDSTLCQTFDYMRWKCEICPASSQINSNGIICVEVVAGCLMYSESTGECVYCEQGYVISSSVCVRISGLDDQIFQIANLTYQYQAICLRRDRIFNTLNSTCDTISTAHCVQLSFDNKTCQTCMPGYYSASATSVKCSQCSVKISHCLICSSSSSCSFCQRGYYLLPAVLSQGSSQCLSCSAYGCLQCTAKSLESSSQSLQVQCISCPVSATLYMGACYACQTANTSFSVQEAACVSCNKIQNCEYCVISNEAVTACKWCVQNYYHQNNACLQLSSTSIPNLTTAKQILTKAAPGIQNILQNDQDKLMSSCEQTNGYICECSQKGLSSVCGSFVYDINVSSLTTTTLQEFIEWDDEMRMAAEFKTFSLAQISLTGETVMSPTNYWNLLSIYTFALINGQPETTISNLKNHLLSSMNQVFSQEVPTILTGNGFYYKYVPTGVSDSQIQYISSTINTVKNWQLIFVWFNRIPSSNELTGHIYIFTDSASTFNVSVMKNGYLLNSENFTLQQNGKQQQMNVALNQGYLLIQNFPNSLSSVRGIQVFSNAQNTIDIYQTERIQYIFYSESFIYILFFLLLYLIFLPLCSMVDCCTQDKKVHRKVVSEEQEQDKNAKSSETEVKVVSINYREFFPIYNVANTNRKDRLKKLCLYIVNLQHGVTFLTLIYFNLDPDLGVAAVALAIPGYLCTVVAGYICGTIFRLLKSHFKYLINLVSLGYWILWVLLMRIFLSSEYKLFLLTFVIIFFIIDLIIDGLETLLVYFAIRQGQNEQSLFKCLAKWLSYRGYYNFQILAKQLGSEYQ